MSNLWIYIVSFVLQLVYVSTTEEGLPVD